MRAFKPTLRLRQAKLVLGLESSADDTCAAVVQGSRVLSNIVLKQDHERFGGIHPHLAQREHQRQMPLAIRQALEQAAVSASQLHAVAYTRGPGMAACLRVCSNAGRSLAAALDVPSIGKLCVCIICSRIRQQAHTLTPLFTESDPPEFPFLVLLASGGHTMLVLASSQTTFDILATTRDEAIGDAFDKVSRLLCCSWTEGNGSPGAALEYLARQAVDSSVIDFAKPALKGQAAFSFSGLRSAVERQAHLLTKSGEISGHQRARIAHSFQQAAVAQLEEKLSMVLTQLQHLPITALVCSGGVASNQYLRERLRSRLDEQGHQQMRLIFPPAHLCTDNAAMIAFVGSERLRRGSSDASYELNFLPKWSIEHCEADMGTGFDVE